MNYLADLFNQTPIQETQIGGVPLCGQTILAAIPELPAPGIEGMQIEPAAETNFLAKPFNAVEWAEEFCRIFAEQPNAQPDIGWVLGWMANAYMKGWDEKCQLDSAKSMKDILELETDEKANLSYSVGTRVYNTVDIWDCDQIVDPGSMGTIIDTIGDMFSFDYVVQFDCHYEPLLVLEGEISWCEEEEQDFYATEEVNPMYSVGDRIMITTGNSTFQGYTGEIVARDDTVLQHGLHYGIKFDNESCSGSVYYFAAHEITHMPQEIKNADSAWTESTIDEIIPF